MTRLNARRDLLPDALMVVGKRWLSRSPSSAGTPGQDRVCEARCGILYLFPPEVSRDTASPITWRWCWMGQTL